MEKTPNLPKGFTVSVRLYQTMLAVYPSDFRLVYGAHMLQVFRDCCRRALLEAGMAGLLSLWWRTILDTAITAIEEYSQRGVYMLKSKFIKLSGWAFILGGLAVVLGGMALSRPEYSQYNARSLRIDQYANATGLPLLVMGFLLICVGFIGLFLRYGQRAGNLGRYSLGVGVISGVITTVSSIFLTAYDNEPWWQIFSIGIILQFLGLVFFGIASLRRCTLPRWNGLPILTGAWFPLLFLSSLIYEQVAGNWPESTTLYLITWLLTMMGLFGLGYLLQSDSQSADIAAAAA